MAYFRPSLMRSCKIITAPQGIDKTISIRNKIAQDDNALGFVTIQEGEDFYLLETRTGKKSLLMTPRPIFSSFYRKWSMNEDLFRYVYEVLWEDSTSPVFLDEIGMRECLGEGFKECLDLVLSRGQKLTITVAEQDVPNVVEAFRINYYQVEKVSSINL